MRIGVGEVVNVFFVIQLLECTYSQHKTSVDVICSHALVCMMKWQREVRYGFAHVQSDQTAPALGSVWLNTAWVKHAVWFRSLSVSKWIHLNWGDEGLRALFTKSFRMLSPVRRLGWRVRAWMPNTACPESLLRRRGGWSCHDFIVTRVSI